MPWAVELCLDEAAETWVRDVWARLADAGLPAPPVPGASPHVSLLVADAVDAAALRPVLRALAATLPRLPLLLGSVGTFAGPDGVIFLAPVVTLALLDVHARVHAAALPHVTTPWDYYAPGRWVPHCTLASGTPTRPVPPEEVLRALGIVREAAVGVLALPVTARALALAAVGPGGVEQWGAFDLGG